MDASGATFWLVDAEPRASERVVLSHVYSEQGALL